MAEYDYVIVNEDLVMAVAQVAAILDAEARRVSRQDDARAGHRCGCDGTSSTRCEQDCRAVTRRFIKEPSRMRITTPHEVAKQAGNKYLGVLVAAKFARYLNEFPKDQVGAQGEKLTTKALQSLVEGELNYKLVRRRRSEA